jgi:hypothetical protein
MRSRTRRQYKGKGGDPNIKTENPLLLAQRLRAERNSIDAQIAEIQTKLAEVERALAARPPPGSPNNIPVLRSSLIKTVEIYKAQLANLRARRPPGEGGRSRRFRRSYKKRS